MIYSRYRTLLAGGSGSISARELGGEGGSSIEYLNVTKNSLTKQTPWPGYNVIDDVAHFAIDFDQARTDGAHGYGERSSCRV
jgi:hypothetical protein